MQCSPPSSLCTLPYSLVRLSIDCWSWLLIIQETPMHRVTLTMTLLWLEEVRKFGVPLNRRANYHTYVDDNHPALLGLVGRQVTHCPFPGLISTTPSLPPSASIPQLSPVDGHLPLLILFCILVLTVFILLCKMWVGQLLDLLKIVSMGSSIFQSNNFPEEIDRRRKSKEKEEFSERTTDYWCMKID